MSTQHEKELLNARQKTYRHNHPDRKNARRPMEQMEKEPCELCKKEGKINKQTEAHHRDYKNSTDIIWLCKKHHEMVDTAKDAGTSLPAKIQAFIDHFKHH